MAAESTPPNKIASVVNGIMTPEIHRLLSSVETEQIHGMFQNLAQEIIAGKAPQIIHSLGRSLCIYSPPAYWQWLQSLPTTGPTISSRTISLADVQAAIIPLSEMPKGTPQISGVLPSLSGSCTRKPIVTPLANAEASFRLSSSTSVGEVVNVYAKGTAAQIMNNVREQWGCGHATGTSFLWLATVLRVPRLSGDQASYQIVANISCACSPTVDLIALRLNDTSVLVVTSGNGFYAPNLNATEAFARTAYTRAKSKLGG